jgi:hypothetical protein
LEKPNGSFKESLLHSDIKWQVVLENQ